MDKNTKICIDYIIDREREDFEENPSKNHVYYHAIVAKFDKMEADAQLHEVIRNKREWYNN